MAKLEINYNKTDLKLLSGTKLLKYNINSDIDVDTIRHNFNHAIGNLSVKHSSLEYWLMMLSERNTLVSDLFLDICRIELIIDLNNKYDNLVVKTNNIAIFLFFCDEAIITFRSKFLFKCKKIRDQFRPYLTLLNFIISSLFIFTRYRDKRYVSNLSDSTIIQTWVNDSNFEDESFHDGYYGDLADYLQRHGKKVYVWPVFYSVKYKSKAIAFIRKHSSNFIYFEDYLKVSDYLNAIAHFYRKRFIRLGKITISSNDFTSVFNSYKKKEYVSHSSLFYLFTKRLKELGCSNIAFIQNHENMTPEKALILGVKKYLPESRHIGYFHTTNPSNILCLDYSSIDEYEIAPKPDLIIFNSNVYLKYYKKKYPKLPMCNGFAFKQMHLKYPTHNRAAINNVLIIFSGVLNEIELMFSFLNTISGEYSYLFRMHPMCRFEVSKYYSKNNYEIVNDVPLQSSLAKVSKVISTYSSVALECAIKGLDVGLIYDQHKLLLNPFDSTSVSNYCLISNSNELDYFLRIKSVPKEISKVFNLEDKFYDCFLQLA